MKRALITAVVLATVLLGMLACRRFAADSIMDKGGMEIPDAPPELWTVPNSALREERKKIWTGT